MNCGWRHEKIVWPFYSFSFWTSQVVWFTGCIGFLLSCFISNRSPRHFFFVNAPSFRFGKVHIPWLLFCCDKFLRCRVHPPRYASCSRAWELDAAWDFEFLLILLSDFPVAMSFSGLLDAIGLFADDEHLGTCEDKFIAVDYDFATILSFSFCSCILFAIVLAQLINLDFLAQQMELTWLLVNKWRRLFHSSRVKLPLVKMSANWCLVSMYRIWITESRLILSNNHSKATLWVLDTCLIVGFRPFIISITASLSSKANNIALQPECVLFDGTWSILCRSRLVCAVGICFRMFGGVFADSQRSRVWIPSCVNLHRKRWLQLLLNCVRLRPVSCTSNLLAQLFGFRKMHRIPPDIDLESSKSPAKSESWNDPILHCCAVFPT